MSKVQMTTEELLDRAGLNWTVEKEQFILQNPDGGLETPRFMGVVRQDNRACLHACTPKYEIFQNEELAELVLKVSEATGYKYNDTNIFNDGGKVVMNLRGKGHVLEYPQVGDVIEERIHIINSHDGTSGLRVEMGSLVLSCTNGMKRFDRDFATSIRHTTNMRTLLEDSLRAVDLLTDGYKKMYLEIDRMLEQQLDKEGNMLAYMFNQVLDVDLGKIRKDFTSDEYSSRKLNQVKTLKDSLAEEMSVKGNNVWGLLSGVTHYTSHKAGTDGTRERSKIVGSLARTDNKAYEAALEMVLA